ncbi:MAG: Gfo/Idh/MocA family oxidoreductase [Chitinophagaceae bacterium]
MMKEGVKNFVLIGAGGYIAPKHMKAIRDTGNNLLAALDKHDSVGILDSYFPEADFFTEFERFDRHIEKLKRQGIKTDYVSVCSPNYLHDAHIRFGLRVGADVICEKPLTLNPWNAHALIDIEKETGRRVNTILQLRLQPGVEALREKIKKDPAGKKYKVSLRYITARGHWYHSSWKGDIHKSGGIATNIGIHFFDMLLWIFGDVRENVVLEHTGDRAAGRLLLEKAEVDWFLSIDPAELPEKIKKEGKKVFRSLTLDEEMFEFSEVNEGLHTRSYEEILNGRGFSIHEVLPSIQLVHDIRESAT